MTVFTCRDSFESILCGVYDAWMSRLGHDQVRLELEGTESLELFVRYQEVQEEVWKSARVSEAVQKKAGRQVYEQIYRASLSRESEKADRIYRYLIEAFRWGRRVEDRLADPAVYELFRMNRQVEREAHHLIEFLRFSRTESGILYGTIGPVHDVAVLLAPHFADRLGGENWVIYDAGRRKAVVHRADGPWFLAQDGDGSLEQVLKGGEETDAESWEGLWRIFHRHISIAERENPACQKTHLPLRYRPYMTEFQRRRPEREGKEAKDDHAV